MLPECMGRCGVQNDVCARKYCEIVMSTTHTEATQKRKNDTKILNLMKKAKEKKIR